MTTPPEIQPAEAPQLVTVPDVEILAAGTWHLSTGETTFTPDDLASGVQAAQCPAVGSPIIKLGHVDPRFDGEPAVGRVAGMRLTSNGNKVTGDLAGVPAWLGDVMASAFPNRSIEGLRNFRCSVGHTHPFVITGLALLGVTRPGVGVLSSLTDVASLYGIAAAAGDDATPFRLDAAASPAAPAAPAVTVEDIRKAYYAANQNENPSQWITEIQLKPPQLIVCDESNGDTYRVPVTIGSGGKITFGDPVQVHVQYVDSPVAAAGGRERFGSPDSSRIAAAAKYTQADVDALGGKGQAFKNPDGTYSYPVADAEDLSNAIDAVGRGGADHDDIRKYIIGRADALGESGQIPATWNSDGSLKAAGGKPGPVHGIISGVHSHDVAMPDGTVRADVVHSHLGDNSHAPLRAAATADPKLGRKPAPEAATEGADMDFSTEQLAAIRAKLGKAEDAELTAADILTALTADAKPEPVAAAALPEGVVAVEKEQFEQLRASAELGVQARKEQLIARRDQTIQAAIGAGKIAPATRERWTERWDKEPEDTEQTLASLQAGLIPLRDIGTAGGPAGPDHAAGDGAEYERLFGTADWQKQQASHA